MKKLILCSSICLIFNSTTLVNTTRAIRGKVVDKDGTTLIGAQVMVYDNLVHQTLTDIDGTFTLTIPKQKIIILQVVYGCGAWYDVLYEVGPQETFIALEMFTKTADKRTKKNQT